MRVLFLSHYAMPHVGGIEVVVEGLAEALRARGHETTWIASAAGAPAGPVGDGVLRVPAWNGPEERLGVPWPVFSPRLGPVVAREVARADVVHAHGALYGSSVLGLVLARRRGVARVLTEHVGHVTYGHGVLNAVQHAAFASVGRVAARSAQVVVVLNEQVEREVRALAPRTEVTTIRNGIDVERFRPPADAAERAALRAALGWDERPRVVFVGRLVAKKAIGLVLDAARAAEGAYATVVVGPGAPPPALPPGVEVLGALPRDAVARVLRAADAFVLPSHGEGFPVTAQEALASGLPVVLRDEPTYGPYLDGAGVAVRLVAPDPRAVAGALRAVLADRERAGAAAVAHAQATFSWERVADEHLALYARARALLG